MVRDGRDSFNDAAAGPSSQPMAAPIVGGLDAGTGRGHEQHALEPFWQAADERAQPAQRSLRRRLAHFPSPPLRVQRVSQLDAELLDAELVSMLLEPVKAALRNIRLTLPTSLEPELLLTLRLVIYKLSVVDKGATYGAMLQNLRYRNEWAHAGGLQSTSRDARLSRVQLALFPVLTIALPYIHTKVEQRMSRQSYSDMPADDVRRKLWATLDRAQRAYSAFSLANFLAFLSDGKYRTLTDRLLGMRLTYAQRTMNRNVSFEFLNRQLVWHAFTEFLLFLLPLIQPRRLLRRLLRLPQHPWVLAFWLTVLPRVLSKRLGLYRDDKGRPRFRMPAGLGAALGSGGDQRARRGKYPELPKGVCAICWERLETQAGIQSGGESFGRAGSANSGGSVDATARPSGPPSSVGGLPSKDPADAASRSRLPLDGAGQPIQPRGLAARTTSVLSSLGRSNNGIAYADASVHTPYRAEPCGHTYCYVCLATKLLSDEAAEELADSSGTTPSLQGADASTRHGEKEKGKGRGDDGDDDELVGAWHCLRCGTGVRRARRDVSTSSSDVIVAVPDKRAEEAEASAG